MARRWPERPSLPHSVARGLQMMGQGEVLQVIATAAQGPMAVRCALGSPPQFPRELLHTVSVYFG